VYHNTTPRGGVIRLDVREVISVVADSKKVTRMLKTARGQLDGILKMVEEGRYCIDISQQVMATEALLNRVNREILSAHLRGCVQQAVTAEDREEKIEELIDTLEKILK
jgi:DNA-binding FrmR family transcriptional regulator